MRLAVVRQAGRHAGRQTEGADNKMLLLPAGLQTTIMTLAYSQPRLRCCCWLPVKLAGPQLLHALRVLAEFELLEQAQHLGAAVGGQLQPAAGGGSRVAGQACVIARVVGEGCRPAKQVGGYSRRALPLRFPFPAPTHLSRSSDSCTGGMSSAVSIRTSCWLSLAAARPSAAGSRNGGGSKVRHYGR